MLSCFAITSSSFIDDALSLHAHERSTCSAVDTGTILEQKMDWSFTCFPGNARFLYRIKKPADYTAGFSESIRLLLSLIRRQGDCRKYPAALPWLCPASLLLP